MPSSPVLVIAEAANPEWTSVPLVGWSLANALKQETRVHVVTHARNSAALERAGWVPDVDFTAIDNDHVARPIWRVEQALRKVLRLGWTVNTALAALRYYHFESMVWRRFRADLERGRFAIVHRVTPLSPTIPSTMAAKCARTGTPFMWGPINGGTPWPKGFGRVRQREGEWLSYVRSAYKLLPSYGKMRRAASAHVIGSSATWSLEPEYVRERGVYLPENAVDPARFPRRPPVQEADGPLRVVFVGRLVPYKGADMLVEACAPLLRDGRIQVTLLGDGPERGRLEKLVDELGAGENVSFLGWVDHSEVAERMRRAHVFGFPSIREFGGGVVLEAMALGVVPVVVDHGGPAELVTPETGVKLPLGTREEIVSSLRVQLSRLAEDKSGLRAMAEAAQERVYELFTWEAKARQILRIYEWVLGEGQKPDFGMPLSSQTT